MLVTLTTTIHTTVAADTQASGHGLLLTGLASKVAALVRQVGFPLVPRPADARRVTAVLVVAMATILVMATGPYAVVVRLTGQGRRLTTTAGRRRLVTTASTRSPTSTGHGQV